jgi:hypothetical protein
MQKDQNALKLLQRFDGLLVFLKADSKVVAENKSVAFLSIFLERTLAILTDWACVKT